jgi:hypothetical protein
LWSKSELVSMYFKNRELENAPFFLLLPSWTPHLPPITLGDLCYRMKAYQSCFHYVSIFRNLSLEDLMMLIEVDRIQPRGKLCWIRHQKPSTIQQGVVKKVSPCNEDVWKKKSFIIIFFDLAEGKNKNMKNLEQLKHHLNEKKNVA